MDGAAPPDLRVFERASGDAVLLNGHDTTNVIERLSCVKAHAIMCGMQLRKHNLSVR